MSGGRILAGTWLVAALAACSLSPMAWLQTPDAQARSLLTGNGLELLPGSLPVLAAIQPDRSAATLLTVFIEGDGAAWPRPWQPPDDPTPGNPLALHLAIDHAAYSAKPDEAVAYLGRPCQYLAPELLAACPQAWWTRGRFGREPLALLSARLDALKAKAPGAALRLVGYSGGGAVAALLAAQRGDVACVVTVAAPLDTGAWTQAKNVSPLSESVNPVSTAAALRGVPMTHFSGSADKVVPAGVNQRFLLVAQTRMVVKAGFDHDAQWRKAWPALVSESCLSR